MNWFHTIIILAVAFVTVFLQATVNVTRHLMGAQVDLLPSLVVYASLSSGLATWARRSICCPAWSSMPV